MLVLFFMSEGITETEFTIYGRVQMVMFRDFARRNGKNLNLTGFVKNNADGSVTAVAQGQSQKLQKFEELLKEGSFFSKVKKVIKKERVIEKIYSDFEIAY